jgi:hypothetical protein
MAFTSNQTGGSPWEPPYRVKLQDDTRYFFDPRTNATRLGAALLAGSGAPPSFFLPHPYREPPDPRPGEPQKGDIRRPFIFGLTPSPPPPGPGHADKTPFIRRLPAGTSEDDKRRSERAHDQLSSLLNSLIGQGIAVQLSPEKWTWRGGARVENRHPTMIDDLTQGVVVGQMWICSTDLTKWICVDNTHNFAVWVAF